MNGQQKPGVEQKRAEKLWLVLRGHLNRSIQGQQLIAAFEEDQDRGSIILADYLHKQLPVDNELAERLATVLGNGGEFTTVVTGGHIDQIINIARLGVLNLTIKKSIFRDAKQVIVFLIFFLIVGTGIASAAWYLSQPRWMDGDFNIAVAEFSEHPASSAPTIAPAVSQMLFDFLESEYQQGELGLNIQVAHDRIGLISGATEAEGLAGKINADVVIYGSVIIVGGRVSISPRFYVSESFRGEIGELTGEHNLALPVEFLVTQSADIIRIGSELNTTLRESAAVATDFTKALTFLATDNLNPALRAIQNAIDHANAYGAFEGKEVLCLTGSYITQLTGELDASQQFVNCALDINASYARAYIAQANIYYQRGDLQMAQIYYERALQLDNQPYGSHIPEKAHIGIGNIYTYQYQVANATEKAMLAEAALSHFDIVIKAHQSAPDFVIDELAAQAYYGSGVIYQLEGNHDAAITAFQQALALTRNNELMERAQDRLIQVRQG
jgi:hypothetical protein